MKTAATLLFILFTIFSFAQSDTLRTKGQRSVRSIIGKWQQDSVLPSNTDHTAYSNIEFNENGEYKETIGDKTEMGKWKQENGMIIKEMQSYVIENLTKKRLALSQVKDNKKVYFYFSRVK